MGRPRQKPKGRRLNLWVETDLAAEAKTVAEARDISLSTFTERLWRREIRRKRGTTHLGDAVTPLRT